MLFQLVSKITITQQTSIYNDSLVEVKRDKYFVFDFVNEFEITSTWENLTDKGSITIPKNIYAKDENGNPVSLGGSLVNIGGFSNSIPLIMRGDRVIIEFGYRWIKTNGEMETNTSQVFEGYVSRVTSKKPIQFEVEDNMWILKLHRAPNKLFKGYTLEGIIQECIDSAGLIFRVNDLTKTTVGDFRIGNETICEVLARLRSKNHFESYFRGNELRIGSKVYIESEAREHIFVFQENIISDDLDYVRKDDVTLSAMAYSVNKAEVENGVTKNGKQKTKHKRLQALVYFENGKIRSVTEEPFPENTGGERRTFYFLGITDVNKLAELAEAELLKYYYDGFRGNFLTFAIPYVRHGDNVRIIDNVLPERNGKYKVRQVDYTGGVQGGRQKIYLDYKINE